MNSRSTSPGDTLVELLLAARLHDPFAMRGLHPHGRGGRLRVFAACRIGLSIAGRFAAIADSDSSFCAGSKFDSAGGALAEPLAWMGLSHSAGMTQPPLAGTDLTPELA